MDFEAKPVISDAMKNSNIGIDMDGEGFKSHKLGPLGKENSQVFSFYYNLIIYYKIKMLLVIITVFAKLRCVKKLCVCLISHIASFLLNLLYFVMTLWNRK